MLTNVISTFKPKNARCRDLISWKHSFKRLNEEYEIAKKKKQALDSLFEKGRISQSTHESFSSEIAQGMAEIERQQKDLLEKMKTKMNELENHVKTLEMLFANYEIQHVAGEVDEEVYQHEINILTVGLETAKHELETVKDAINQLSMPEQAPLAGVQPEAELQTQPTETVETSQTEVKVAEETVPQEEIPAVEEMLPQPQVEPVEIGKPETEEPPQEPPQVATKEPVQENPPETVQSAEETPPSETKVENAEKQET
jgi:hypothetical protein